jgi:uncharacterized ion transporter superfamily protein YfcC
VKAVNTYLVIFAVVALVWLLTWIVPVGKFEVREQYVWDPQRMELDERVSLDPDSFEYLSNPGGGLQRRGVPLFGAYHGVGLFNYVFQGVVDSAGIVVFILVIGGAFGIIIRTGAIEAAMYRVIQRLKGARIAIIPGLFLLFSFGGATFGMGEEAIPFAMIVIPILVALGYDAITGVLVTYGATQIGFASSWMNPFSIAIAQGIAGIPVLSGLGYRVLLFAIFTLLGTAFTMWYAMRVQKDPTRSLSYESDAYFREGGAAASPEAAEGKIPEFGPGEALVLLTVFAGIVWVALGVTLAEYYIPEIATQFFIMGLVSGVIAVIFKMRGMTAGGIADSFVSGARDLLGAALIVGMAKGILIILTLGGDPADPSNANMLNSVLYVAGNGLRELPRVLSAWVMYLFQALFNFFVPSGSGKAALTMPLMAPLAQYAGVSRQVSVLAFQLGDGFTNMIVPTSAALMGVLAVARLDWITWVKSQLLFQAMLAGVATVAVVFAVVAGPLLGPDWVESSQAAAFGGETEINQFDEDGVYRLGEGERIRIIIPTEPGAEYAIYLTDSYNLAFYESDMAELEVIRALWFRIFDGSDRDEYADAYLVTEAGGGVTPESAEPAARVTAAGDSLVLEVDGYKSSYAGLFSLAVEGPDGPLDPTGLSLRRILPAGEPGSDPELRSVALSAGQVQLLEFRTEPGIEYRLYLVDSYNNRQNAYPIPQQDVLRAYQFELLRADGQSPYPRSAYRQYDEDKEAGVAPLGSEIDIAPPAAVFTARDEVTLVRLQGYNPDYAGLYAWALAEGPYEPPQVNRSDSAEGIPPGSAGAANDDPGPAAAPAGAAATPRELLSARAGSIRDAQVGPWLDYQLAAGGALMLRFDVESGTEYGLYVADSYSNEVLGEPVSDPVEALWFAVLDGDELLAPDAYAEGEYTAGYDIDGGYSATENIPSASFTVESATMFVYLEGSKEDYQGALAIRLERIQ